MSLEDPLTKPFPPSPPAHSHRFQLSNPTIPSQDCNQNHHTTSQNNIVDEVDSLLDSQLCLEAELREKNKTIAQQHLRQRRLEIQIAEYQTYAQKLNLKTEGLEEELRKERGRIRDLEQQLGKNQGRKTPVDEGVIMDGIGKDAGFSCEFGKTRGVARRPSRLRQVMF